jgi:hypothetical protein
MAQLINVEDVQSWLTEDRLLLEADDELTEETNVSNEVKSVIEGRYDTSLWTTRATTPTLIKSIISAQVAAIRYRKVYADQLDEESYADWLDNWFKMQLEGVSNGQIQLLDAIDLEAALISSGPSFHPDDQSSILEPAKFSMGMIF